MLKFHPPLCTQFHFHCNISSVLFALLDQLKTPTQIPPFLLVNEKYSFLIISATEKSLEGSLPSNELDN